jgi:uncharacterized Zn-binding protein involved in type VI secretion
MSVKAVRVGDIGTAHDGYPQTPIITGSSTVKFDGIPAARLGDALAPHSKPKHPIHSRSIASGSSTVFIDGKAAAITGGSVSCGGVLVGGGTVYIGTQTSNVNSIPLASIPTFDEQIRLIDKNNKVLVNVPYYIETNSGAIYKGISDRNGKLDRVPTEGKGAYTLYLGVKALEKW